MFDHLCTQPLMYYSLSSVRHHRNLSAARTNFSSAWMPRRASRQSMAATMGKAAVNGNASACEPCCISTARTTYHARLTNIATRQSVACSGLRLYRNMAIKLMADANIWTAKSDHAWK